MTQLRDRFIQLDGMKARQRHDVGTGEPCQAAGCPSRHTRKREGRGLVLCDYHAGVFA